MWITLIWFRISPLEDHRTNSEEFFYFTKEAYFTVEPTAVFEVGFYSMYIFYVFYPICTTIDTMYEDMNCKDS
jgi:hypothetical protein